MNCEHCGWNTSIQPPKSTGCNHVHYPEACDVCNKKKQDNCKHYFKCVYCGVKE